ncbi:MAG: type II toxin-antitoxin system HicA family toxin [Kiloniellales bacterium]|jgi:predicted RNA binding protein YcfA (HicA-like mRNA interferase family)
MKSLNSREILKDLKADGWQVARIKGSHHMLRHPEKPGLITVPHPKRKMHPKTVAGIYKAAGLPVPK